jgi:hypothetical protein
MLFGAITVPLSSLQPSVSNGPQSIDDACATINLGALADGAAGFTGFVCAPASAAYRLTATANTARRVPKTRASPFCFFISFS